MARSTPIVVVAVALLGVASTALAQQPRPPRRQVPSSVLVEVEQLEGRFELALARDCDGQRCFPSGCTYVDHAVADRPRSSSLPGLGQEAGPSPVEAQAWLTKATCSFAHEQMEAEDVQALVRRLQGKLSQGWLVVSVGHKPLESLPAYVQDPPEPPVDEAAEAEAEAEPEVAVVSPSASQQLWDTLLDDFWWMILIVLGTLAGTTLIWAFRRVGRASIEEQALLAQLAQGDVPVDAGADDGEAGGTESSGGEAAFVASQTAAWRTRLDGLDAEAPDPELQAMLRELLRMGELSLLAKAVLMFPDALPAAFPSGGDVASAKLELSDYLKDVDLDSMPSDAEFFRALNRHALSAALASQRDAEVVRSLREEFGAAGLVSLLGDVSPRAGALLFALAPATAQREAVRLLAPRRMASMADQLLRSNRMAPAETTYLFEVLEAARQDHPLPPAPQTGDVSDRGAPFDATGALSMLLPRLDEASRAELLGRSLQRFGGSLPSWYQGIVLPDMLLRLPGEARADLFLGLDAEPLAAWLSTLDGTASAQLLEGMPTSLQASVRSVSGFASVERQLALAEQGRRALARGFQAQLARAGLTFDEVVRSLAGGAG